MSPMIESCCKRLRNVQNCTLQEPHIFRKPLMATLTLAEVHFLYWKLGGKQIN